MYYYFSHTKNSEMNGNGGYGGDVVEKDLDHIAKGVAVEENSADLDDELQQKNTVTEKIPVIIYVTQISEQEPGGIDSGSVMRIFRKTGAEDPEALADVGGVGEYPSDFLMSPDNRFVLINLVSKLQVLDIATKKLTDVFVPKREVCSVIFSPDGKQLMIWDQKNAFGGDDDKSRVHIFDLTTRTGRIIREGDDEKPLNLLSWRSDGKVVAEEVKGSVSRLWFIDAKSGHMTKTPVNDEIGPISSDGMLMAVVKSKVTDICDGVFGESPGAYKIINPVSGEVSGVIDGKGESIFVIAFSPDGSEVLYRVAKPWDKESLCNQTQKWRYYKANLTSGDTVALDNKSETLKSWNRDYVGAEVVYRKYGSDGPNKIILGDETIETTNSWCDVIGEYYSEK
ncbi:MAG TPA: hypothetical protein GX706_03440 [Candidatus Moranbacteria bacterium]|nr:hypothetical protein [Candidatus Moranbacteria bacterium]